MHKLLKFLQKLQRRRLIPYGKKLNAQWRRWQSFLYKLLHKRIKWLPYSGVKKAAVKQEWPLLNVYQKREINIAAPQEICGQEIKELEVSTGVGQLPELYVTEIPHAMVIGGTDLVLQNNCALYDELALTERGRYGFRSQIIRYANSKKVLLDYTCEKEKLPRAAIHFCKDHSYNYFHWLMECLPRLELIDQFPQYDKLPLLIDADLPQPYLDALAEVNGKKRQLYFLKRGGAYYIERLIYPSELSALHDNYTYPTAEFFDNLLSPLAVDFIYKHLVLEKIKKKQNSEMKRRRLFISRKNTRQNSYLPSREFVNANEIESLFIRYGFEIVYCELLTLENQRLLFSEAEIIAGVTGAGMTNMLYAPKDCQILLLNFRHPKMNYYVFNMLAQHLGLKMFCVLGDVVKEDLDYPLNSSFKIEVKDVENAIAMLVENKKNLDGESVKSASFFKNDDVNLISPTIDV